MKILSCFQNTLSAFSLGVVGISTNVFPLCISFATYQLFITERLSWHSHSLLRFRNLLYDVSNVLKKMFSPNTQGILCHCQS